MGAAISSAPATFSDHVFKFLERVEHRVASNPSEREAAFRLRYDAYRRIGFLKPRLDETLYDPLYDDDPMAWTIMSFVDGELAGTVRVNFAATENAVLPGLQAFSDILAPRLRGRQKIVEFTRLAAKISLSSASSRTAIYRHASGLHGRPTSRRRFRRCDPARGTRRLLQARVRRGAVVQATRLSRLDSKTRMYGRELPRRAKRHRGALSVLQIHRGRTDRPVWGSRPFEDMRSPPARALCLTGSGAEASSSRLNGADAPDRGLQTRNVEGVDVERRFARANLSSAAPVQKIPKADHHQFCVFAAERQSHEPAVPLIQPIIISWRDETDSGICRRAVSNSEDERTARDTWLMAEPS